MPSMPDRTCLQLTSSKPGYRFHEIFGRVLCSPTVYSDPQVPREVDDRIRTLQVNTLGLKSGVWPSTFRRFSCMALRVVPRMFLTLYLPQNKEHAPKNSRATSADTSERQGSKRIHTKLAQKCCAKGSAFLQTHIPLWTPYFAH